MLHDTELIGTLTAGLVFAFIAGFIAIKLGLPPIVGYLLAGIAIGPFTPGYEGDAQLAPQLAEIGVILLMFGVGIHFSVKDLLSVKNIAVPGALGQIAGATILATIAALMWGWSWGEGIVLGLAIAVASTVVLLRAIEDRNALTTTEGRIAVGWLIVEDLFTVLALVFLPVFAVQLGGTVPDELATDQSFLMSLVVAVLKLAALGLVMVFVAARAIPWLLQQVARTGSRELFTLSVLASALGIAFAAAYFFDVSLALGAFLAGLVVAQSNQSHQAAADALPMRDSFAVLFFVSVGMLFDPQILLDEPLKLGVLLLIIMVGKSLVAFGIVVAFGHSLRVALVIAAALAQIGEFSFILANMGRELDLVSEEASNLILGAALLSITLNPLVFRTVDPIERWVGQTRRAQQQQMKKMAQSLESMQERPLVDHAVVCGGGAVGMLVVRALQRHGVPYMIVEQNQQRVDELVGGGLHAVFGDASNLTLLEHANLKDARVLIIAMPEIEAAHQIVRHARRANPNLQIVVRTRRSGERDSILGQGVPSEDIAVSDMEVGLTMIRRTLIRAGINDDDGLETLRLIRQAFRQPVAEADSELARFF